MFASEQNYASTLVGGRYRLFNNAWNKGATSGRYRQNIFVSDDRGQPVFGWVWKWRDSSGVATYPEVQAGVSPWNGEAAPDSGFPFLAGSKKLVVDYDIDLQASGSYNLAFEFWAVSGEPVSKETITHEVMIWVASGGRPAAAGSEVAKPHIGGHGFSVDVQKNHGDSSGAHSNTWTIITLIADQPILHGPLDIGAVGDYLVESGLLGPAAPHCQSRARRRGSAGIGHDGGAQFRCAGGMTVAFAKRWPAGEIAVNSCHPGYA